MKSTLKTALSVGLLALPISVAASSASAEGWSIYDLEEVAGPRENCMQRARNTLSGYMFDNGGGETDSASWTNYAYDLEPGDQDVVIMCPVVNGGVVNAFLVVHGAASEDERIFTADEIERIWKEGGN